MSSEVEHVLLEPTDNVVTVRDRLSQLRGKRVLLIWPQSSSNLRRKLDLVLIQRDAFRRAIQLALVSQKPALQRYAADLNISCFPSVEASQLERWKRGRHKVFLPRYHKPSADLQVEDFDFIRARRNRYSPWRTLLERIVALLLLTFAIGAALYMVVPGAVVKITLQQEDITVLFDVIADRKVETVDTAKRIIPARTIRATVEATATLPTSGSVRLDSVSAGAVVTFTNLGSPRVEIPRGAILATSAGEPILFETVADIVVPAGVGQHADGAVIAMESYRGSVGNVGPGLINTVLGGLDDRVSVINLTSAAGGSNRSVKSVAVADQDKLLEIVRIQLQSLAYEQIRNSLSESQVIVIETIKIEEERKDWTRFSAAVGTMTGELSLSMRAVVSALAVDDRYGRQLLLNQLRSAVPADSELLLDTVSYSRGPFSQNRADGQINFTVTGNAATRANLDSNQLREQLTGKSLREASELLANTPAVSSSIPSHIDLFPAALQLMPRLAVRIDIQLSD